MEWSDYIQYILSLGKEFDNITISLDEGRTVSSVPPIIKASILMLDKMIERQGKRNVLIFPEKMQSIFIFTLMKLFHNITSGRIQSNYDPTAFNIGEKLKVGNAIVEYIGTEVKEGKTRLKIRVSDVDSVSSPLEDMPIFQKVSTHRNLSKYSQFIKAKKAALAAMKEGVSGNQKLSYITEMRTHMDSSVLAMTSVAGVKEQIRKCKICDKRITDVFYVAQSDYEGGLHNISSGQMTGVPAIVFSSDLYALNQAAERTHAQSVIIDGSNMNILMGQMDALDELLRRNIPIVCITDVINSFDLNQFEIRDFNIWRWDKNSIPKQLYGEAPLLSNTKTKNCAEQDVQYLIADAKEISDSIKILSKHRKETILQSAQIMKLFEKLNRLAFSALRTTIAPSEIENDLAQHSLNDCALLLNSEASFLEEKTVSDYLDVITSLRAVYTKGYLFRKNGMLKELILKNNNTDFYLVIPEGVNRSPIQEYWNTWRLQRRIKGHIKVLSPAEYYSWPVAASGVTVIAGWLKRAIMRKIIFSYNTGRYFVLLYDYENRWKNHDSSKWKSCFGNSSNKEIIENAFSTDNTHISTEWVSPIYNEPIVEETVDELGEIELILRDNKYRQYANSGSRRESEPVAAIPVNFVGSLLAFYKTSHKIVSATRIITADADKIEEKYPNELKIGDFIVVRETDRDLVKELADIILANSGKSDLRELAGKWRDAIKIELLFSTVDALYEKMKVAGCEKGIATLRRWIDDEDIIAPQSKEDLKILATVTENEALQELSESIYDAAQEVRRAHILAGRKISEELRTALAKELRTHADIDPFNIWEPIDIEVEGIGNVKVLKIIDIGSEILVDVFDTNRLIAE